MGSWRQRRLRIRLRAKAPPPVHADAASRRRRTITTRLLHTKHRRRSAGPRFLPCHPIIDELLSFIYTAARRDRVEIRQWQVAHTTPRRKHGKSAHENSPALRAAAPRVCLHPKPRAAPRSQLDRPQAHQASRRRSGGKKRWASRRETADNAQNTLAPMPPIAGRRTRLSLLTGLYVGRWRATAAAAAAAVLSAASIAVVLEWMEVSDEGQRKRLNTST